MGGQPSFFRQSLGASTFKTLRLSFRKRQKLVLVYPKVMVTTAPDARIEGTGVMQLGIRWEGMRHHPGEFKLGKGALLRIEGRVVIYTGLHISVAEKARLVMGSCHINTHLTLDCFEEVVIGQEVAISKGVTIRDSDNHAMDGRYKKSGRITIGDHAWIGLNSTILKGVTIGAGAVVGAGSVVTRDVPPRTLVGGVPARVIREDVHWE